MRSRQPKVLHRLCGRPLIAYALRIARTLADRIVLVVRPRPSEIAQVAGADVTRGRVQRERLGHRPRGAAGARGVRDSGPILVLPGDMPLLTVETIERLARAPRADRSRRHDPDRARRQSARLWAGAAPAGAGQPGSSRSAMPPTISGRSSRDQHLRVLLRRSAAVGGPRRGAARQRPGRVLPHRRHRHPGRGPGRGSRPSWCPTPCEAHGVNDRRQLAAVAAIQRRRILDR